MFSPNGVKWTCEMTIVPLKAGPFVSHFLLLFFLVLPPTPVSLHLHRHGHGRAGRAPATVLIDSTKLSLRCCARRHGRASS
jgi:hypothetical protein